MSKRVERSDGLVHCWVVENPCGDSYMRLVRAAAALSDEATFVVDPGSEASGDTQRLLNRLRHSLLCAPRITRSWPGTPKGASVLQYRLRLNAIVVGELAGFANSWFDWALPNSPEDLSFMKAGAEVLVGVTHERLLYVNCTRGQFSKLCLDVPGLVVSSGPGFRGGK